MEVSTVVAQCGGACSWGHLRTVASKRAIRAALADGAIGRVGKGRYVLPSIGEARALAIRLQATASHTTAALHWRWSVKQEPDEPHLTFPRGASCATPRATAYGVTGGRSGTTRWSTDGSRARSAP